MSQLKADALNARVGNNPLFPRFLFHKETQQVVYKPRSGTPLETLQLHKLRRSEITSLLFQLLYSVRLLSSTYDLSSFIRMDNLSVVEGPRVIRYTNDISLTVPLYFTFQRVSVKSSMNTNPLGPILNLFAQLFLRSLGNLDRTEGKAFLVSIRPFVEYMITFLPEYDQRYSLYDQLELLSTASFDASDMEPLNNIDRMIYAFANYLS